MHLLCDELKAAFQRVCCEAVLISVYTSASQSCAPVLAPEANYEAELRAQESVTCSKGGGSNAQNPVCCAKSRSRPMQHLVRASIHDVGPPKHPCFESCNLPVFDGDECLHRAMVFPVNPESLVPILE